MPDSPVVSLDFIGGLGLIIQVPSGVLFTSQVGGVATLFPRIEGIFVPLIEERMDHQSLLRAHFIGPKWRGQCYAGIDQDDADVVDRVLSLSFQTAGITVDRSRLADSCEAWIYVTITDQTDDHLPYAGFGSCKGVLTWINSD